MVILFAKAWLTQFTLVSQPVFGMYKKTLLLEMRAGSRKRLGRPENCQNM
jgi:hypothetical protein